jgi:excisionase family DNA binding protein
MEKRLVYRVRDVAELFGMSEPAVWKMIYSGLLPARRWGARVVFLREELEEHLRSLKPHSGQEEEQKERSG